MGNQLPAWLSLRLFLCALATLAVRFLGLGGSISAAIFALTAFCMGGFVETTFNDIQKNWRVWETKVVGEYRCGGRGAGRCPRVSEFRKACTRKPQQSPGARGRSFAFRKTLQVGDSVPVFYNPENTGQTLIIMDDDLRHLADLKKHSLALFAAIVFLIFLRSRVKERQRKWFLPFVVVFFCSGAILCYDAVFTSWFFTLSPALDQTSVICREVGQTFVPDGVRIDRPAAWD
jgi:hypothetical protein